MATASEIFDKIAKDYATHPDKDFYLEIAEGRTSCGYKSQYNLAVALRAAHMIELANGSAFSGSGSQGAITSKREGKLAIGFAAPSGKNSDSELNKTKYGQQLLELAASHLTRYGVTGGGGLGCHGAGR